MKFIFEIEYGIDIKWDKLGRIQHLLSRYDVRGSETL